MKVNILGTHETPGGKWVTIKTPAGEMVEVRRHKITVPLFDGIEVADEVIADAKREAAELADSLARSKTESRAHSRRFAGFDRRS
jgi:hypothetical protein